MEDKIKTIEIDGVEFSFNANKAFEKDGHVYCRECGDQIDSEPLACLGSKKIIFSRRCKCDREEETKRKDGYGHKGFLTSEIPYLKEHNLAYNKMLDFIRDNNLVLLKDNDLKSKVNLDGRLVSLYYKFFNQEGEDPLKVPY